MPLSRYPRPGQIIAPSLLRAFLTAEAPLGAGRFCDLDESAWKRFDMRTCKLLARALVGELAKQFPKIEMSLSETKIPCPQGLTSFHSLELETGTFNCLKEAHIDSRPGGLGSLTVGEALEMRSFGIKSLIDLMASLESFGKGLQTVVGERRKEELTVRKQEVTLELQSGTIPRNLKSIVRQEGHIPKEMLGFKLPSQPEGVTLNDLNVGIRVFNALAKAGYAESPKRLWQATLNELLQIKGLGESGLCDLVGAAYHLTKHGLGDGDRQVTVDEELLRLLVPSGDLRRREIIASHFGLEGRNRSTLESVGKEFGISKERVRQICASSPLFKKKATVPAPVLDSLLERVENRLPRRALAIESELTREGLLAPKTRLEAITELAVLLNRTPVFAVECHNRIRFVADKKVSAQLRKMTSLITKLACKHGILTISYVQQRLSNWPASLVNSAVKLCPGFRWLEKAGQFFWLKNTRRNILRRRIRRILSVAPRIAITDLRAALRRDHQIGPHVPPTRILVEFCRQVPDWGVDGPEVYALHPEDPLALLRGDEAILIRLLIENGPVCQRVKLQKLASEAGVGIPSFWRCLSFCPTITRFGRGVFGLTGAKVVPGEIDSLICRGPTNDVLQDHGWTKDGRVWIAYRISRSGLETGVLGVPAAKRDYIQGEFEVRSVVGKVFGTLVIKGSATWGFRSYLLTAGAEEGDIFVLEISPKGRFAIARLGDDSLLDEMEDA